MTDRDRPRPSVTPPDPWSALRRLTPARVALGRAGGSLPTAEVLRFAHDHALAAEAVMAEADFARLAARLRPDGVPSLTVESAAPDRTAYLQRPDLGRRFSAAALAALRANAPAPGGLTILVSDGLAALAAERHAPSVLAALLPRLHERNLGPATVVLVRHARVGLLAAIGELWRPDLAVILLGERPGLGAPDSLGAYLEFRPSSAHTDADRNCISNIRPAGLDPALAAAQISNLLSAMRAASKSGVTLKAPPAPGLPPASADRPSCA